MLKSRARMAENMAVNHERFGNPVPHWEKAQSLSGTAVTTTSVPGTIAPGRLGLIQGDAARPNHAQFQRRLHAKFRRNRVVPRYRQQTRRVETRQVPLPPLETDL